MFKHKSNGPFNNNLFNCQIISIMHNQMERLYEAAKTLKNICGQSELARALNASPQTVKNWEYRGISKQGLLTAQRVVGCSAEWIETGTGTMQFESPAIENSLSAESLTPLSDPQATEAMALYAAMSPAERDALLTLMRGMTDKQKKYDFAAAADYNAATSDKKQGKKRRR